MNQHLLKEIFQLPISDRIRLVQDVLDSIATHDDGFQLSADQLTELEKRIDEHRHPGSGLTWQETRRRLHLGK